MKVRLTTLLLLCVVSVQAQEITGKITDKNNNPIEFATVVIQTMIHVNSTYTDSLGIFKVKTDALPFFLIIQHFMYETYQNNHDVSEVGNIQLDEKSQMWSEVVVKGERPIVRVIDGRMTYDIQTLLSNKVASSTYEAVLELPGVHEQRGNIELAGVNGVSVVINGKVTNMGENQLKDLLKNIPKERIQQVEIMYSAPSKYHIRGAVINLVFKSGVSDTPQLQGQINTLYNQGHYANYQGGATVVYNTPKPSTDFMYSFGYNRERTGEDISFHHLYNGKIYDIEQFDRGYTRTPIHTIRLDNGWFLNEKNKISFTYTSQIQQWSHPFTSSKGTYSDSENRKRTDKPIQMYNLALDDTSGFGLTTGFMITEMVLY